MNPQHARTTKDLCNELAETIERTLFLVDAIQTALDIEQLKLDLRGES